MSFWEVFSLVVGSVGVFASIFGAFYSYAARKNGEATRTLLRDMARETQASTREFIGSMEGRLTGILERMDTRWQEAWERMDQRADERHREALQLMERLRPS